MGQMTEYVVFFKYDKQTEIRYQITPYEMVVIE